MSKKKPKPAVVLYADGRIEEVEIEDPSLAALQKLVGGMIQLVQLEFRGKMCDAYVNEEGKIDGLPYNPRATIAYNTIRTAERLQPRFGEGIDPVMGNMVVMV